MSGKAYRILSYCFDYQVVQHYVWRDHDWGVYIFEDSWLDYGKLHLESQD